MADKNEELIKHIVTRLETLSAKRGSWSQLWQDCTDYVNPNRGDFSGGSSPGINRVSNIYDTTAPLANEQLASGLHGFLTPSTEPWFSFTFRDEEQNDSKEVKQWLQLATKVMFDEVFNAPHSNFVQAIHELYLDIGAYGTAVMYCEDYPGRPVNFRTYHLSECSVAENVQGQIDTLYREYNLTSKQILERYGSKGVLDSDLVKLMEDKPSEEYSCVHAVEPQAMFEEGSTWSQNQPFRSVIILKEKKVILEDGSIKEFPFMVPRWTKTSGEIYGRSPAMTCMPDIKMINAMARTTVAAAEKATDPPLTVPDDGFTLPIDISPGGLNYYQAGTQDKIEPLATGARPDVGEEYIKVRREHITKTFHVDWLQLREGPQMTATEVLSRQEEKMRLLGPMVGRLQNELLGPMINRVFNVLVRRNRIPESPGIIQGEETDIVYISQVARAQKVQKVLSFMRFMEALVQISSVKPDILDTLNSDKIVRWMAEESDVPLSLLMEEGEVNQMRQQRQQQQQQQQQADVSKVESESNKNMAEADKIDEEAVNQNGQIPA